MNRISDDECKGPWQALTAWPVDPDIYMNLIVNIYGGKKRAALPSG
jgi:hypothetical protein